ACEEGSGLTLQDAPELFPDAASLFRFECDLVERAHEICDTLRDCEHQGSGQHLFLLLYFGRMIESLKAGASLGDIFLPLPKARFAIAGEHDSITVDFGFWTGERFVVVLFQEDPADPHERARAGLLRIWGFDVFRLVADEFETQGLSGNTGRQILESLK